MAALAELIRGWATALGFTGVGISKPDLAHHEPLLRDWLAAGHHGDMQWLADNLELRLDPAKLLPGTMRVISVRLDYLPTNAGCGQTLADPKRAYISRYALGRDYHKLMRNRLKQLGEQIAAVAPETISRPFSDSAPVLERPLAAEAGLGWIGKHTLLLDDQAGSWFFLGELLVNLPLPVDQPLTPRCGNCVACITICPTGAIIAPYQLDARRCISYLTIEHQGAIPEELRPLLGNRIYGCDDCQLVCPWNRYAQLGQEADFQPRHGLDRAALLDLWQWDEATFLSRFEGSAIRRIGFERWQRNLAVALGNAPTDPAIISALEARLASASPLVADHIHWALARQRSAVLAPGEAEARNKQARLVRVVEKGLPREF